QSSDFMLMAVLAAAALSLVTVPLAGFLSDRVGRRRVYAVGILAVAFFVFPYFGLLNTGVPELILLAVVVSLIPHDLQYGPQAALIAESFTGRRRYSGASIGYQLASVVAGGPAPLIAAFLLGTFHTWVPIATYIVACALVGLGALILMPDRSSADHTV